MLDIINQYNLFFIIEYKIFIFKSISYIIYS